MRRLWLVFAQTTTICLGILFVVSTLRPELLEWNKSPAVEAVAAAKIPADAPGHKMASFSDAARKALPSVVSVFTGKDVSQRHPLMDDPVFRFFFGEQYGSQTQRITGLGSGVIVSDKGYVLTNNHVIEAADEIEVALADTRRAKARVVGTDPETDLAVLKIELKNLPAITFALSDQARIGDVVLAIGNPLGVGQTVTMGIVSALHRSGLRINAIENFIQTDAAINQGNSGGALIDTSGNLVGINTAILSQSERGGSIGIGFAIPSALAKQVMEQVIASGVVTRGWVGIGVQDVTPELAGQLKLPTVNGALITEIVRGSPADKAGLKPGDLLVAVENNPVTDYASTLNLIAALKPGATTRLKVIRDKNEIEFKVSVGKRPMPRREAR